MNMRSNKALAPMYRGIALLVLVSSAAWAEPVEFSPHSKALRYIAYDEQTHTARFKGSLSLTGKLYFSFDIDADGRIGDVLSARFVPDPSSLKKLPAVVGGERPSPISYVSLEPEKALSQLYPKGERVRPTAEGDVLEPSVIVVIRSFTTSIECDSRTYEADLISIKRQNEAMVAKAEGGPHGC